MYVYFENIWVCLSSITKWNSILLYVFPFFFCMCINCVYLYLWPCLYSIVLSLKVPHILCQMWFERINEKWINELELEQCVILCTCGTFMPLGKQPPSPIFSGFHRFFINCMLIMISFTISKDVSLKNSKNKQFYISWSCISSCLGQNDAQL